MDQRRGGQVQSSFGQKSTSATFSPHLSLLHHLYMHNLTLSSSSILCHSIFSLIVIINFSLSSAMPAHLNNQCSTFSTSSLLQFLHTLPSLPTPRHLPVSTSNAAVPPLNCTRLFMCVCVCVCVYPVRFFQTVTNRPRRLTNRLSAAIA